MHYAHHSQLRQTLKYLCRQTNPMFHDALPDLTMYDLQIDHEFQPTCPQFALITLQTPEHRSPMRAPCHRPTTCGAKSHRYHNLYHFPPELHATNPAQNQILPQQMPYLYHAAPAPYHRVPPTPMPMHPLKYFYPHPFRRLIYLTRARIPDSVFQSAPH